MKPYGKQDLRPEAVERAQELVTKWFGQAETLNLCGWDDEVQLDRLSDQIAAVLSELMDERDAAWQLVDDLEAELVQLAEDHE